MKTRYTTIFILLSPLLFSDQIKLRIDEIGKVGVGVVNPSTKLDVDGSITIGNLGETETPKAGTIKFENGDFLGFDGSSGSLFLNHPAHLAATKVPVATYLVLYWLCRQLPLYLLGIPLFNLLINLSCGRH